MIEGTDIQIWRLYHWHRRGLSTDVIVKRCGGIPIAHVLSALAFAYDNAELFDGKVAVWVGADAQLGSRSE